MICSVKDETLRQELLSRLADKTQRISIDKDTAKGGSKSIFSKKKNKDVDSNVVIGDPFNLTEKE